MKDNHKQPTEPNEIAELKHRVVQLEEQLDFFLFNLTLSLSIIKSITSGTKIKKEELDYILKSTFEVDFTE